MKLVRGAETEYIQDMPSQFVDGRVICEQRDPACLTQDVKPLS